MTNRFLKFGEITRKADIRWLYDIKDVIYDTEWLKLQDNFEVYYMYRDLHKNKIDYNIIKQNNLRYDITIIPPKLLGSEFIKTAGHYHSIPEVYQVLEGKATYLLQKIKLDNEHVEDFIVIRSEKGDSVIIPPNYGHITINESKEILKMANWIYRDFLSEYNFIKKMKGMAYFLTTKGFIKNLEYKNTPDIRYLKPTNFSEYGFEKNVDIYELIKDVNKLKFLINPDKFLDLFSKILNRV
jgi:glucose-6-phosphate isomerase